MWIGFSQQTRAFRSGILAPDLGKAQEEALLRSKSVLGLGGFGIFGHGFAQRHERDAQAAIVGRILAQGQASVEVNIVYGDKRAVLIGDAAGALFEFFAVFLRPPVGEVALSIKLAALIVKAMGKLVADHNADAAKIHRIVFGPIKEGRL